MGRLISDLKTRLTRAYRVFLEETPDYTFELLEALNRAYPPPAGKEHTLFVRSTLPTGDRLVGLCIRTLNSVGSSAEYVMFFTQQELENPAVVIEAMECIMDQYDPGRMTSLSHQ